jgi:hypothetical protein
VGAELVSLALAHWTHVSDRAFRVLIRMSLTALDKPNKGRPAAVYHGGRELLAMTLRSKKGTVRTQNRMVQEALAELSEQGAIRHLQSGWAGQKAVYRLTLDPVSKGVPHAHPVGGPTAHPMGVPTGTKRVCPTHTPRNQEEPLEELAEETRGDLGTAAHAPRATGADPENVIRFPSPKPDRKRRIRDEGKAELSAKAAMARDGFAAIEARRKARKEAN